MGDVFKPQRLPTCDFNLYTIILHNVEYDTFKFLDLIKLAS